MADPHLPCSPPEKGLLLPNPAPSGTLPQEEPVMLQGGPTAILLSFCKAVTGD